jgi:hypothetical protein
VLVIGDDPVKLLEPYDENIETDPRDDEQVFPEKALEWAQRVVDDPTIVWRSYYSDVENVKQLDSYHEALTKNPADPDDAAWLLDWYSSPGSWYRKDNGEYWSITRYNPLSKWDWYSLGGRWRGSLKLKEEALVAADAALGELSWTFKPEWNDGKTHEDEIGWVDQCRKGDLDLDGMLEKKEQEARQALDELEAFIAQHGPPPDASWFDAKLEGDAFKAAREAYWKSPWMVANAELSRLRRESKATVGIMGHWDMDDFRLVTEHEDGVERFIAMQRARAIPGYALLDEEHGWVAPGEMGWFGMSSDSMNDRIGFYEAKLAIVHSLPDEALLSVYDCHI